MSRVSEASPRFMSTTANAQARTVRISIPPSILRVGLTARLLGASLVVAAIWVMIGWTIR